MHSTVHLKPGMKARFIIDEPKNHTFSHFDSQITQFSVERCKPAVCPQHIRLRVMWDSNKPPKRDDISVSLTGLSKDVSFILECIPGIYMYIIYCL